VLLVAANCSLRNAGKEIFFRGFLWKTGTGMKGSFSLCWLSLFLVTCMVTCMVT